MPLNKEPLPLEPDPQSVNFPPLALGYTDASGPGQATITPQGPDPATGGL